MPFGGRLLLWSLPLMLACAHEHTASPGPEATPSHATPPPASSGLGTGDVFEVRVFQEPDLTGVYCVAPDGSINFPLC